MSCSYSWCQNLVISDGLCEAHKEIGAIHRGLELQSNECGIKDRALKVACTVLNEWATMVAFEGDGDKNLLEHIGRAKDQCLNAQHGKLSSDPFPKSLLTDVYEFEGELK